MPNEIQFEPGWLRADMERASQRVGEWSKVTPVKVVCSCERQANNTADETGQKTQMIITRKVG